MAGRSVRVGELARADPDAAVDPADPRRAGRHAPRGHAPRDRRRRVRRHRRHRHDGGPRRGARSATSRTSTTSTRPRPPCTAAATSRSTACSTSTTSRTRPASSCPRAPTRRWRGFLMQRLGRLPQAGDWVDYAERRITVREVEGRRVGRVLVTAVPLQVIVDPDHPISIDPPPSTPPTGSSRPTSGRPREAEPPTRTARTTGRPPAESRPVARLEECPTWPTHPPARPRVLSGIQPTADSFHFGNYLGALRQWVALQDDYEPFFFIADLHAITVEQDPKLLRDRVRRRRRAAARDGHRPGALGDLRAVPGPRARPARLGAAVPHRLRRGPPDDAVQGQVRQGRRGRTRRSGCSPTRSCRPPTSCSTGRSTSRSARTSASTSS